MSKETKVTVNNATFVVCDAYGAVIDNSLNEKFRTATQTTVYKNAIGQTVVMSTQEDGFSYLIKLPPRPKPKQPQFGTRRDWQNAMKGEK